MEILGVDIGGSGIKGAVVDAAGGTLVSERRRIPTPQPATPAAIAAALGALVEELDWHGAVACGFPARVNGGVVRTAANIDASWIRVNAEQLFSQALGQQVMVINDADAAGIAEMRFGAGQGRGERRIMMLTIGTGIGSAMFLDGRLYPNTELGHLSFQGGIAEHYCSAAVREREGLKWKEFGRRFNEFLLHLEFILQPDLFILGGGASRKFERFSGELTCEAPVVAAQTRNLAGIIGAAVYGAQRLQE